jgi:hypothetical protein
MTERPEQAVQLQRLPNANAGFRVRTAAGVPLGQLVKIGVTPRRPGGYVFHAYIGYWSAPMLRAVADALDHVNAESEAEAAALPETPP